MKLLTSRFGEIELQTDKIMNFPNGIPGFENQLRFIMLQTEEELPFSYMQSVNDGDLAFIVTNPFLFFTDYQFDLPQEIQNELNLRNESDVMIFSIVTVNAQAGELTLNLLAPIVLNMAEKVGQQIILHQTNYKTKHVIHLDDFQPEQENQLKAEDV